MEMVSTILSQIYPKVLYNIIAKCKLAVICHIIADKYLNLNSLIGDSSM